MSKKNKLSDVFSAFIVALLISVLTTQPALAQQDSIFSEVMSTQESQSDRRTPSDLREILRNQPSVSPPQKSQDQSLLGFGTQQINIHVLGDVAAPGVYKTPISDRAADVLGMARPNRRTTRLIQLRHPGEKTRHFDLYQYYYFGDLAHNPYLKDNDVIFVPKSKGAVRVEGPVARSGVYELGYEKTLYQIVQLAGGFTSAMSKMHPLKVIRFSDGGEKFVLDVVQDQDNLKKFSIQKGDVVVVPDVINGSDNFDYTVESIPGENLVYPTAVPEIYVIGAVSAPGPYPYKSHLTVKDYLGFAGAGATSRLRSVKILREGKRVRKKMSDKVQAGDVVIVYEKSGIQFLQYLGVASTVMSVTLTAIVFRDTLLK